MSHKTRKVQLQGKPQTRKFVDRLNRRKKRREEEKAEKRARKRRGTENESLIGRSGRTMTKVDLFISKIFSLRYLHGYYPSL
jgi:hypothetical protein